METLGCVKVSGNESIEWWNLMGVVDTDCRWSYVGNHPDCVGRKGQK